MFYKKRYIFIHPNLKESILFHLVSNFNSSIIIFTSTFFKCYQINSLLHKMKANSVVLHSLISQKRRMANLDKFKSEKSKILVATDVASR